MAKKKTSPSDATPEAARTPATRRRAPMPPPTTRETAADASPDQRQTGPTYEQIAEAAYQRYLSRGGAHGRDFDDWLEAERELRARG